MVARSRETEVKVGRGFGGGLGAGLGGGPGRGCIRGLWYLEERC